MPNWCNNTVLVKGDKEEIQSVISAVYDSASNNHFSFDRIKKCPEELLNASAPNRNEQRAGFLEKKYGAKDWYDWCNMNWGTKWNSSDAECKLMEYGDTSVAQFTFATAWAPPIPVIEELAKQFPNTNIYISYDEPGMSFSDYFYYADGEISSQQEFDQSYSYLQMLMEPTVDVFEYVN